MLSLAVVVGCSADARTGRIVSMGGAPASGGQQSAGAAGVPGSSAGGTTAAAGGAGGTSGGTSGATNAGSGGTDVTGSAGATNAGGANGGSAGAGGGSAATGCSAPGLVFCDDFETATTDGMPPPAPKWSVALNGMGTVVVDGTTPAHSGSKSVHVSSGGGYQTFFVLSGAPVFPAPGPLYLRVYIRLGAPMSGGHNTYYKAGASDMPSSDHETRIGVMNGMLMINQPASDRGFLSNQNYYNDGNKPGVVFTPMTWTCVEALFDPAHSTIDMWVDEKEIPDLHHTDWQQDPLGSFHFGFEKYAGPDADIWYDDVAVSAQPVGCK
jgi:hypothetical protein